MHGYLEFQKIDRPSVSQYGLGKRFPYLKDLADSQGMDSLIRHLRIGTGIGHVIQVNDCETSGDFTESDDGTFDIASAAVTGKRVGTNCMKLTATGSTDGTQYVQTLFINESLRIPTVSGRRQMDWRDTRYVGFWKHAVTAAEYGSTGELEFAIVNDGIVNPSTSDLSTAQATIDIAGTSGQQHHWCEIDLNSYARNKVEAIRFYSNNTSINDDTYIDDIVRYDVSVNNAPLYGCGFPIKSGTTLTDGETVRWTIDGLIASVTSASVADLGPCWLDGDASRTGTAKRSVWAFVPGAYIIIAESSHTSTAGTPQIWTSSKHYADASANENSMLVALEGSGEAGDWLFMAVNKGGAGD